MKTSTVFCWSFMAYLEEPYHPHRSPSRLLWESHLTLLLSPMPFVGVPWCRISRCPLVSYGNPHDSPVELPLAPYGSPRASVGVPQDVLWESHSLCGNPRTVQWDSHQYTLGFPLPVWESHSLCGSPTSIIWKSLDTLWESHDSPVGLPLVSYGSPITSVEVPLEFFGKSHSLCENPMTVQWDFHWYSMGVPWPLWESPGLVVGFPHTLWDSHESLVEFP